MRRTHAILTLAAVALAGLLLLPRAEAGGNIEALSNNSSNIINAFWDPRTFPIRYRLNQNPGLGFTSTTLRFDVLEPAFNAWEDLPENSLDFTWGGTTASNTFAADGVNALIFAPPVDPGNFVAAAPCTTLTTEQVVVDSSDTDPTDGLGWLRVGITNVLLVPVGTYDRGTNVDCDIIFNVFDVTFSKDGTPPTQDIQAVATHEIGHWLSLSHSFDPDSTIYPFTDTNPLGDDGGGPRTVEVEDAASVGKYYKEPGYDDTRGTITGHISIDGFLGDGVQIHALDASNLGVVAGRFSISRFMDTLDVFDGDDFLAEGGGFYRLDGLPPGDYYVYAEWLDSTDEPFGRLDNRYNLSGGNSTVADGGTSGDYNGALGYRPERFEFYNTLESGDGGDGSTPGSAGDNPDEAVLVTVGPGEVVPGVNIDINLDPDPGKTDSARSNPTGISRHDTAPLSNLVGGQLLPEEGNEDNYWIVRYPAASLPATPYNVHEGVWTKNGRSDKPYTGGLLLADPNNPLSVQPFIVYDPPRLVAGGPDGGTGTTEQVDVRDRFNVTINEPRDLFVAIRQPESGAVTFVSEGYFVLTRDAGAFCSGNGVPCNSDADCNGPTNICEGAASGNTLLTFDGFASFSGFVIDRVDVIHRLRTESAPPVMITGSPTPDLAQGFSGPVTIQGQGFRSGATVRLLRPAYGPAVEPTDVDVLGTTFVSASELQVDVSVQGNATPGILDVEVTNPEVVIPNRSRLLAVVPGLDTDGDGWADAGDCAPGDIDLWSLPGPVGATVTAQVPAPGTAQFDWLPPAQPGGNIAVSYDVVQGSVPGLRASGGTDYGACQSTAQAGASFVDSDALAPGEVRLIMVAPRNGCGAGSYVTPDGSPLRDSDPDNC